MGHVEWLVVNLLDQIVVELDEELAKSEIFQGGNGPNGPVISEGASRPLISETDPDVRYEAIHQIVKVAEEKHMDGHPAKVVGREVEEILNNIHTKKDLLRVAREIRNEDRMERQAEKEAKRDELGAVATDSVFSAGILGGYEALFVGVGAGDRSEVSLNTIADICRVRLNYGL
jgi:hypothetical protein